MWYKKPKKVLILKIDIQCLIESEAGGPLGPPKLLGSPLARHHCCYVPPLFGAPFYVPPLLGTPLVR